MKALTHHLAALEKKREVWFLLSCSIFFFLLRLPSLFEPNWYGDEGIYQILGKGILAGRLLYRDIWDNKPPLLYLLYALLNADQFLVRLASLVVGLLSLISLFFLSQKLFRNLKISMGTTLIYAVLFGTPFLEGNIANAENFMYLPILVAMVIIYSVGQRERKLSTGSSAFSLLKRPTYQLFSAGLLVGVAFLFKIVAIFDLAAVLVFLYFSALPPQKKRQEFIRSTSTIMRKSLLPVISGFLLPLLITIVYFTLHGALSIFLKATFLSNIGYVGYNNKLFFPQDILIFKLIILAGFIFVIFLKRLTFERYLLFLAIWGAFGMFNLFFSQRPYTHYLLVYLPCFSLLLGLFFMSFRQKVPAVLLILLTGIIIYTNFGFYNMKKSVLYYGNFLSYVQGHTSTLAYQTFFDKNTPRDYAIAAFLKAHTSPNQTVFLWGNSAQVYVLSHTLPPGRFAVAYHMSMDDKNRQETQAALTSRPPKYIAIFDNVGPMPFTFPGYTYLYTIENTQLYEQNNH